MKQDKILIIVSKFNELVTQSLLSGAKDQLSEKGINLQNVDVLYTPGSFELPSLASKAAKTGKYDAIICLGCVIKGETPHFDYICQATTQGLMTVSVVHSLPVIFGVLTTETMEQALARCGLKHGHKGRESADAAIIMLQNSSRLLER